ncbi:CST complex subunit TEN1 [Rhynchospora pubera]|uniref:CST complex subunit TEN1 n=1 Tax=Rhynchospora pubera TaxID=906938 RepID=A0AAV8EB00_9POAL|nr:CST complex subunit TEN1 [Rhynchospora pubera]KAJ4775977.1 CST complex subunit TEN1 [Rhynchospora pubera]KAJ4783384.1 CST complex subunit TEN1 [Rhynchospora pubera]KAJ4802099.1 CST complex subunit TEN1 [Rhynchospora pubera]
MASLGLGIKPGVPLMLRELQPFSPFFKHGQSLRLTGKLEAYQVDHGFAEISDGIIKLKIDTRHLTGLVFCVGSLYQFIGELLIDLDNNNVLLEARVGRIVDGLDLNLYQQSLHLSRNLMGWT